MTDYRIGVVFDGVQRELSFSDEHPRFEVLDVDATKNPIENVVVKQGSVQRFWVGMRGQVTIATASEGVRMEIHNKAAQGALMKAWERWYDGVKNGPVYGMYGLDFSQALVDVRLGKKIWRQGWHGQDQFVVYQKGYPQGIAINANTADATGIAEGTVMAFKPYLMFKTAEGAFVPWVASQSDLLAMDWVSEPLR